jgi:hypothetical protein
VQIANTKALSVLDGMLSQGAITQTAYDSLQQEIQTSQDTTRLSMDELHLADFSIQQLELSEAKRQLLEVKKDCLIMLAREGLLEQESLDKLRLEIDEEINHLVFPE